MSAGRSRSEIAVVVGSFLLVIGITAVLAWRVGPAPDEEDHLTMVDHHGDHLALSPLADWELGTERGHVYHLYSPVPYAAYAPFEIANDGVGPVDRAARPDRFITRLGGLVIAAAQLAVTLLLVRRMCRRCSAIEVTAVALAANLIPQLRYVHAYLNADGLTILAATAAFAVALRVLQRERLTLADAALVGLTLGVVAHGKFNAYVVAGVLFGVFAICAWRQRESLRHRLRLIGVVIALPTLLAGSFHLYIYNQLGNRHLIPTSDQMQLLDSTFKGAIAPSRSLGATARTTARASSRVWSGVWVRFVDAVELEGAILVVLAGLVAVGTVGLVFAGRRVLTPAGRLVGVLALGAGAVTWAAMAIGWSQSGRFLLPTAISALAAVVLGSAALVDRLTTAPRSVLLSASVWIVLLLGLNVWAVAGAGA